MTSLFITYKNLGNKMPIIIPNFASTEKITAEKVNNGNVIIEEFLNGNLTSDDFDTNQVESRHVHPAKFYGSPSPRGEFASSDIVYRQIDHTVKNASLMWANCSTTWEPIPDLSMTIHVKPSYLRNVQNSEDVKVYANVIANWTVREITDDVATTNSTRPHTKKIAEYVLCLQTPDGVISEFTGTRRYLYQNGKRDNILSTQNLSICTPMKLGQGINSIFVAQRIMTNVKFDHFRIYVFNRNIVCDVNYL